MPQHRHTCNHCHESADDESDPHLETTVAAIDWNVIASIACRLLKVSEYHWGSQQLSGGYNIVRFLHMDDDKNGTVLVVRVPYRPEIGWTPENSKFFADRLSSEVATMRYVRAHTSIPVPRIIHHSAEVDSGGVGSPYIIMTKVDGVALSSVWDDMEDSKREIVLRQIVDILLELASQRFDKIGMLFQQESHTDSDSKNAWYIMPYIGPTTTASVHSSLLSKTFTSVSDYWLARTNTKLNTTYNTWFGHENKIYEYGITWFLRSIIPALYDPSLDISGFPICPGDFHSQNIMIVDADTSSPRISGVIDWEFSCTRGTSSFSQYPFFIIDHPIWDDDHPLRARNVRDQATFISLMREAERKKDPSTSDLPLSHAFAKCHGVYLFEQCIESEIMFSELYPQLFAYIYGEEEDSKDADFSTEYYMALENGILKKEGQQFRAETEVWKEVLNVLGSELVSRFMSRIEFRNVVENHVDRFPKGGLVRDWLEEVIPEHHLY